VEKEELDTRLAASGYRLTPQRMAVMEAIRSTDRHPDAHWIYQAVREKLPQTSLGTVYRTLKVLEEAGMLRALHYSGTPTRYDACVTPHYHVLCRSCGRVADIDLALGFELERQIAAWTDFCITDHRLEFFGLCPECQNPSQNTKQGG